MSDICYKLKTQWLASYICPLPSWAYRFCPSAPPTKLNKEISGSEINCYSMDKKIKYFLKILYNGPYYEVIKMNPMANQQIQTYLIND